MLAYRQFLLLLLVALQDVEPVRSKQLLGRFFFVDNRGNLRIGK